MISFNNEEAQYIKKCLKYHDWWQSKKIVEKINYETSEKTKQKNCKHKFSVYKGEEYKCSFCGQHPVG